MPYIYNAIDPQLIGEKVLEIGCAEENLLSSILRNKILRVDYQGIDVQNNNSTLPVIKADIISYKITELYDTILMLEVLEHIHLRNWQPVIKKLQDALKLNGHLIISVPAHQKLSKYLHYWNTDYYQIHTVFGIDKKTIQFFFPHGQIKKVRYVIFNQERKNILWAVGRFVKRWRNNYWLVRDHYLVVSKKSSKVK